MKRPGTGNRLRIAGLALFGLATIAALIGLVQFVNRTQPTTANGPVPTTSAPITSAPITSAPASTHPPSMIPFPPPVISSPAAIPEMSAPAALPEAGAAAPVGGHHANRGDVRIYNNSTIRGLAARAARDLSTAGWTVVEIGNYARGTIPTTTVYYQEGTDQRAIAEAIAAQFGMRVEPRFPGISSAGPGVIVIVTNDYSH